MASALSVSTPRPRLLCQQRRPAALVVRASWLNDRRPTGSSAREVGRKVEREPGRAGRPLEGVAVPREVEQLADKATQLVDQAKGKWERTEDKPSVILLAGAAVLFAYVGAVVVDGVDRIPLVKLGLMRAPEKMGGLMEFVGIVTTAVWAYRWYASPEERSRIKASIRSLGDKVGVDIDI